MTHSSPSSTARVLRSVGSDPETSGSVIEKNDRVSPSTSGFNRAAGPGRQMRRPQSLRLRASAQRRHQLLGRVVLQVQCRLRGIDVLFEEGAVRRAQLFELLEGRKLRDRHAPIIAP
jgi:hypothetical protein